MRRILETLTLIARLPRRLPRVTLLLGLLLLLGGSLTGLHYYALYHWRRAEAAIQDSRLDEARESLSICLRVWPLSVRTHLLAARADRLSGKFDDAERHLKECLRLQKGANEDIQLEFLLMRVQAGDVDEVGSQLMLYVDKKHPDTASILETISGAYVHNLRYGPALAAIERWIVEVPGSGQPLQLRGWIMERLNSHEEAMRDYLQAVALSPELVPARLRLADAGQ